MFDFLFKTENADNQRLQAIIQENGKQSLISQMFYLKTHVNDDLKKLQLLLLIIKLARQGLIDSGLKSYPIDDKFSFVIEDGSLMVKEN